ncbi:MAG TPA: hypothetical protein VJT67_03635 [Longimicrobiaceae bacterium]|nr:hypothetical protein [Longimicrobiaceae bacterium]
MRTSILLLLAGFAALVPNRASAQEAQTVPCAVPVASSAQEQWQQVSAQGFTFCIPASWRAGGGRNTFRGEGGWVRWGTGDYRATNVRTVTVSVPAASLPLTPPGRQNRFAETIGGSVAELWDNELEGRFYTGAQWRTPQVYLVGQSGDMSVRDRQLEIYRTVRFTQP